MSEYLENEQGPAVRCIVMYSTEDKQEPTVKQPQEASKISDPQEASPALVKPVKIPNFPAASCACIFTKGVRKGKQCRFRVSDETGFCHHHKKSNLFKLFSSAIL